MASAIYKGYHYVEMPSLFSLACRMYGQHFSHFDVEKGEFVCPICARLFNCVLPMLPPLPKGEDTAVVKSEQSFAQWSQEMQMLALDAVEFVLSFMNYDT